MQTISDRIQKRLRDLNLKQADLVRATKAGRTTVSNWVNGNTAPTGEFPALLAEVLKCDTTWLLTGKTNRFDSQKSTTDFEHDVLNADNFARDYSERLHATRRIPVLNYVKAGQFCEYHEDAIADEFATITGEFGENVYAVIIEGNSMEPDFYAGNMVIVDPDLQPNPGDYVVALTDDKQTTFKQYRPKGFDDKGVEYFHLIPSNSIYPIIDSRYQPFTVCAVAVEMKKRLR